MRLQGRDWYNYRKQHHLTLLCISTSKAGNYRADCVDETGKRCYHWLHPIEQQKLKESDYFKTHRLVDSNELYIKTSEVRKKIRNNEIANLIEETNYGN